MPKTDAEWRALAARIAGMMEFEQKESHGEGTLFWVSEAGEEYLVEQPDSYAWMDWDVWQPHKNVGQAMGALEGLSQKGVNYSITRFAKHELIVQLWGYLQGSFCVRRRMGTILRQIICLAVEAWMDAQKETQDDPG